MTITDIANALSSFRTVAGRTYVGVDNGPLHSLEITPSGAGARIASYGPVGEAPDFTVDYQGAVVVPAHALVATVHALVVMS